MTEQPKSGQGSKTSMREILSESDYDTELGVQMAQDARRVSNGDLSEEAFYDLYHDAVLEEFQLDDWSVEADT